MRRISLKDFEIQTDLLILARNPDQLTKKGLVNCSGRVEHRVKIKENENRDKYLGLVRELKSKVKVMVIIIVIGALGTIPKGLVKWIEDVEIWGQVETIQYPEKSLEDLRRLAVTEVKYY